MKAFVGRLFSPAYSKMWMGALGTIIATFLVGLNDGDVASIEAMSTAIGGFMATLLAVFDRDWETIGQQRLS